MMNWLTLIEIFFSPTQVCTQESHKISVFQLKNFYGTLCFMIKRHNPKNMMSTFYQSLAMNG